jgi:hypothetical protein
MDKESDGSTASTLSLWLHKVGVEAGDMGQKDKEGVPVLSDPLAANTFCIGDCLIDSLNWDTFESSGLIITSHINNYARHKLDSPGLARMYYHPMYRLYQAHGKS